MTYKLKEHWKVHKGSYQILHIFWIFFAVFRILFIFIVRLGWVRLGLTEVITINNSDFEEYFNFKYLLNLHCNLCYSCSCSLCRIVENSNRRMSDLDCFLFSFLFWTHMVFFCYHVYVPLVYHRRIEKKPDGNRQRIGAENYWKYRFFNISGWIWLSILRKTCFWCSQFAVDISGTVWDTGFKIVCMSAVLAQIRLSYIRKPMSATQFLVNTTSSEQYDLETWNLE